jgi:hypothetical protein
MDLKDRNSSEFVLLYIYDLKYSAFFELFSFWKKNRACMPAWPKIRSPKFLTPQRVQPEVQALILNRTWHKTYLNFGNPVHLVDGKYVWLVSIMKYLDWLQVHIKNSFKNRSVKATIIKVKLMYQIPLSYFFEFLFFYALW